MIIQSFLSCKEQGERGGGRKPCTLFYEVIITLTPRQDKDNTRKEK